MLIDLETAKRRLRMDDDVADQVIFENIEEATSIVLDYLKLETEPDPVPPFVRAATLLVLEALFDGGDPLSDTVVRLLHRYRDPAFA
ncbi:MAG: head-tail connector protein [Pigmentiphaga sp.]